MQMKQVSHGHMLMNTVHSRPLINTTELKLGCIPLPVRVVVFGPQLGTDARTKDRWKNPRQCVPSYCENNHFRSVVWETVPFHCLSNFDYPAQWVLFPLRPEKLTLFYKICIFFFSTVNNGSAAHWCPALKQVSFLIVFFLYFFCFVFFVQAPVSSWVASALPGIPLSIHDVQWGPLRQDCCMP